MKFIPKDDLIMLLNSFVNEDYSVDDIIGIFDRFGDNWFVMDGDLQCTNENQDRKRYINNIKRKISEEEFAREIR